MTLTLLPPLLLGMLVTAMLALCMFVVAEPRNTDGLRDWAWAMTTLGLAQAAWAWPTSTTGWPSLTVLASSGLLSATLAFTLQGLRRFHQQPQRPMRVWGPSLLALGWSGWSAALLHQQTTWALGMAAVILAQSLQFLRLMHQHWRTTPGSGKYLLTGGILVLVGSLGSGLFAALHGEPALPTWALYPVCMAAVASSMGCVQMSQERAHARQRQLAYTDTLTGLDNRRAMEQHLAQQLAQASRSGQALSLLLLDIDHFKRVNDEHGHLKGDTVLYEVAQALRGSLRSQDLAGRWGGEEFLVLLPNTTALPALVLAERLRTNVAMACSVTISIGLHTKHSNTTESAGTMLEAADHALYEAKSRGRNCVEASPPSRPIVVA